MTVEKKMPAFARFAWFALIANLLVIVWGVFLRASASGDGCGQFWLTCNGEVIPSAPQFKTVIEFTHRMTTGIDGVVMLVLLVWAIVLFYRRRDARHRRILIAATGAFIFVFTEAAVGAGLVLTGNTALAVTDSRPLWAIGHLINTFILLAFLTATVWFAVDGRAMVRRLARKEVLLIALGLLGLLFVGMSGSLAALSSLLFPSQSLAEGLAKDFASSSGVILKLRILHPFLSVLTAVYLIFLAGWLKSRSIGDASVAKWSRSLSLILGAQVIFGAATLLSLGPIVMQLGHLLLADIVWISFILLNLSFLAVSENLADQ